MRKSIKSYACFIALSSSFVLAPAPAVLAQNAGYPNTIRLPQGAFNPSQARRNITIAPSALPNRPAAAAAPSAFTPGNPIDFGPSRGPIGSAIRLRVNQNLGATPALISFKAVVSRGIPARVHTRLLGSGGSFQTPAPAQLCIQGGDTWEAELVLSNGRNLGVIGTFTPTNCPR